MKTPSWLHQYLSHFNHFSYHLAPPPPPDPPLLHFCLHFIDLFPFLPSTPFFSSHAVLLQSKEVNTERRRGAALPAKQLNTHKALCEHAAHTRMLNLFLSVIVKLRTAHCVVTTEVKNGWYQNKTLMNLCSFLVPLHKYFHSIIIKLSLKVLNRDSWLFVIITLSLSLRFLSFVQC